MADLVCAPGTRIPANDIIEAINERATSVELQEHTEVINDKLVTNNGFDRYNLNTLGIVEFCPSASAGVVYRYANIGGTITFTKHTGQTYFAYDTLSQTILVNNTLVIYPNYGSGLDVFTYYVNNSKVEVSDLKSKLLPTSHTGLVWFYFSNETLTLEASATPTENLIIDYATVAIIYYNAEVGEHIIFANEQHGIAIPGVLHKYLHDNVGALYTSGLDIIGLSENSTTYNSINSGWIADEDINSYSEDIVESLFLYKSGIDSVWYKLSADNKFGYINGIDTNVSYNEWTGTGWKLTELDTINYTLVHFLRTNDGEYPFMKIIGENIYDNATEARAGAEVEMTNLILNGLPTPEIVECYTMIMNAFGELIALEDNSLAIDWRSSSSVGSSTSGGSILNSLHSALSDTDIDGHPTDAIVYDKTVKFTGILEHGLYTTDHNIDLGASQYQSIVVDANISISFTAPTGPATTYLHIYQGATGGLITLPEGEWSHGRIMENSITPNTGHDLLMIHYTGSGYIYGMISNLSIPL